MKKRFIYLLFCQGLKIISYIFFGSSLCFIGILIVSSCVLITSCLFISISGAAISLILQRSCLFPDYEKSAQESTLTLIENGWNNLAERGIINRDTVLLLITLMKENAVRQYAGTKRLFFRGLRRNLCTGCIWKCFARSLGEDILKIWFGFRWKPAGTGYKKMPESL